MIQSAIQRLSMTGGYFTIALRRRKGGDILSADPFEAEYVFPASKTEWCADPMIAEENGKAFLFYEAVSNMKGRIEVRELRQDCTVTDPVVLFQDDGHYSYPFVFQANGSWYMIPESSDREEVTLYRGDPFPFCWKSVCSVLHGRFVDTTVFPWKERWILLSFETDAASERVLPRAFELRFSDGVPTLDPLEWPTFDPLQVRGAGPVFRRGEDLIRPVQISTEQRYGDSVSFHKISVMGKTYTESPVGGLTPDLVRGVHTRFDGLHTYSACLHFEAIDIRCRRFDWKKPLRRLIKRMK